MPSSAYVDPNTSLAELSSREEEIRALKAQPATRRAMALGDRYQQLQVPVEQLKDVEEDFRKARLFEAVTISRAKREVELDEQRRLVAERQREDARLKQVWLEDFHRLRQKAFDILAHEAETVRAEEARRLEADKRSILQVERSRLLERRQAFEAATIAGRVHGGGGGGVGNNSNRYGSPSVASTSAHLARNTATPTRSAVRSGTPTGGGSAAAAGLRLPPNPNDAPLLVMNVTLGNGREEKITVRVNDDPRRIAVNFAKKHQLPDSAAVNLANQIKAHLSSRMGVIGGSGWPAAAHTIDLGRASTPTGLGGVHPQRSLYAGMNSSSVVGGTGAVRSNSALRMPSSSTMTVGGWGGAGVSPSASRNSPSVARRAY